VYLLPMVLGLLITSVTSGQLISRYGRYRVYPIVGTAAITVALYLMSRLAETTPALVMDLYFFILGLGLGLVLQVLVIAVQNAADYADLGTATSSVTFFRTIGGSFGVAIFGSVFSNRLATELTAALRGAALPPGFSPAAAQANPALLKRLPGALRADILHAYTLSFHTVFLGAVPVAFVAFVLTWFLREVPLRATSGASDLGEGLGAVAAQRSSVEEIERALLRLADGDLRREGYTRLAEICGLGLPAGSCWVLAKLAKRGGRVAGTDLAREAGVTMEHGRPYVDKLVDAGYVQRDDGALVLTSAGSAAADRLFAAGSDGLRQLLAGWSPEQHADLAAMLDKLSRALLGERADEHLIAK
jgi:DNA-binding MarR family transcriptional regulator